MAIKAVGLDDNNVQHLIIGLNRENIDWTWGCISLDNDAIDEFARFVWVGTPVLIED